MIIPIKCSPHFAKVLTSNHYSQTAATLYEGFQLLSPQKIILAQRLSGFIFVLLNTYYVDVFLRIIEDVIGEHIAASEFTIKLRLLYIARIHINAVECF